MSAAGNVDRGLTEDEKGLAATTLNAFVESLGNQPREVATYTLAAIIRAMVVQEPNAEAAQEEILTTLAELVRSEP